jgi:voltage-gated potassium channel
MAALALRPAVISFLDIITHAGDVVLDLEDVEICKDGEIVGKTLKEAKIPERTGLVVLAIQKKGEKNLMLNPSSDEMLKVGDVLIVLGQEGQINQLRNMASDCGIRNPLEQI